MTEDGRRRGAAPLDLLAVVACTALVGTFAIVGADALWAVAMGDAVSRSGDLHPPLPYVAGASEGWAAPLALGELVLWAADLLPTGLVLLQVLLVAVVLAVTVREGARLGSSPTASALAVALTTLGALAAFVIMRLPSLSLVPFVLLAALLRRQHDRPTSAIWWAPTLLALWANLHGGVLIGAALLGAYLVGSRARIRLGETVLVGSAALLALCATPALWRTPAYYVGVFENEAARRGSDLWARPDPTQILDALMLIAATVLVALVLRRRPPLWEVLAIAGLVVGTAMASRNGVWLLLLAAPAIARSARGPADRGAPPRGRLMAVTVLAAFVGGSLVLARDPATRAPGDAQVAELRAVVGQRVVLATEPLAETLAARGFRVWAGNPIDAFPQPTQVALLDFLAAGTVDDGLMSEVEVVVARADSNAARGVQQQGWVPVRSVGGYVLLERSP